MRKFIPLAVAAVIAATLTPFVMPAETSADDNDTIKIMCIGDSITDGYVPEYSGSYRKFIYHGLTEKGYKIDMVGSKDGGYTPTYTDAATGESFEYDNENTGYSGYAIKAYPGRNGILETLQQTQCLQEKQPDIVTLQIGTNNIIDNHDINASIDDLSELIDYILENTPETTAVFVTPIPPLDPNRAEVYDWFANYRHSPDWQITYNDFEAENSVYKSTWCYNTDVEELILNTVQKKHPNVYLSRAGYELIAERNDEDPRLLADSSLLFDGVHPNNDGYRKMGEKWVEVLDGYLSGEAGATSSTTTSTTTATASTATTATTAVTTEPPQAEPRCRVSDLVSLSRFLLGDAEVKIGKDSDRFHRYDIVDDNRLDMFDLVAMRRLLVETADTLPIWD
ncbi:MAG: hypothetical protein K6A75_09420 [Ruminococcus sp.]|nr:hypothetical protein [Ruminococcus sp.]